MNEFIAQGAQVDSTPVSTVARKRITVIDGGIARMRQMLRTTETFCKERGLEFLYRDISQIESLFELNDPDLLIVPQHFGNGLRIKEGFQIALMVRKKLPLLPIMVLESNFDVPTAMYATRKLDFDAVVPKELIITNGLTWFYEKLMKCKRVVQ